MTTTQNQIESKIAVITGASRGLGKSMALHLADNGVDVVGTYRGRKDDADAVVADIERRGKRAAMVQLDVAAVANLAAFADHLPDTLATTFGRRNFDFLVNNAGIGINAPFAETTEAQYDELLAIQLKAPFFLSQKLLPLIVDGGRILNVSSGLARFTLPGYAAYASTKGAIEVLTRYMAKELGSRGITVNTIAPGAIATDFGGGAVRDDATVNKYIASTIPLGRVGSADDVGGAVAALLTAGSGWINGERIEISGGQNL